MHTPDAGDPAPAMQPGSCREVFQVALPLILTTGSMSVLLFIDRMFLAQYDTNAIRAALPGGVTAFTFMCFFIGTVTYVNAFVAQYHGAKAPHKIGSVVWHGIYLSFFGALLLSPVQFFSESLFAYIGHDPKVQVQEVIYFRILMAGSFFTIVRHAFSTFYIGRGKNWVVMWVNVISTALNGLLDYVLIFGVWGFPELGILGAGIGTVAANMICTLIYLGLFLQAKHRKTFRTDRRRFDWSVARRLFKYGMPSGYQFLIDLVSFTIFVHLMGNLGKIEQACGNIVFSINSLAFMPMIGMGMAITTLVGKYVGMGRTDLASRSTRNAFLMSLGYMMVIGAVYLFLPDTLFELFRPRENMVDFSTVKDMGAVLLRYVALYCLFDSLNLTFAPAIKGAGDTRFVMLCSIVVAVGVLVIPTYVAVQMNATIQTLWIILTFWVCILGVSFWVRYRGGKWKRMKVIEIPVASGVNEPAVFPASTTGEGDLP